jgi:hypothetical protein
VKKIAFILIPVTMLLAGCPTPKVLPDIPKVEFRSFVLGEEPNDLGQIVLIGVLNFYFEDGDGDIGFEASFDSLEAPDSVKYNLFLTTYERVDGQYQMMDTSELDANLFFRIPPLDREGQNKTLKGEIEVAIEYYIIPADTVKYSFFLMDRAFNHSNTDTTSEIVLAIWKD